MGHIVSITFSSRASAGHRMDSEERAWYLSDNNQGVLFLTIGMLEPIALPIHVPLHYGQRLGSDGVRYFVAEVVVYTNGNRKTFGFVISPDNTITVVLEEATYKAFLKTGDTRLLDNSVQHLNVTPTC
jgi:hypothetical protein